MKKSCRISYTFNISANNENVTGRNNTYLRKSGETPPPITRTHARTHTHASTHIFPRCLDKLIDFKIPAKKVMFSELHCTFNKLKVAENRSIFTHCSPSRRGLLEKLIVPQLVKKLPALYVFGKFISILSTAAPYPQRTESNPWHLTLFLYDAFEIIFLSTPRAPTRPYRLSDKYL